eukprot:GFYU01003871.1.p1 GENE.GFYU01003871.1~~GFYU01003871.1.p1  ORF type:complete len:916 (-),score=421.15 GFYU01003871.1:163-2910(-)
MANVDDFDDDLGEVPPFANEYNQQLGAQIREKQKHVQQLDQEIDENNDRINIITEHLKNVKTELQNTQQMYDAKQKEIETENHMFQLAMREAGRLRAEMVKIDKESSEVQDKINSVQNSIFKASETKDQFKLQMNWNQEELEQWALAAKQKEEDNLALLKYKRQDEVRIKELNLVIEKVAKEVQEKKSKLEHEITETQAAQIELDKTAEDFRNLHKQRQDLLKQWGDALEAMQKRDEEIKAAGERFAQAKVHLREKEGEMSEKNKFVDQLKTDNKKVEVEISSAERAMVKVKEEYTYSSQALTRFADEVAVVKGTMNKVTTDLTMAKQANMNHLESLDEKRNRLERLFRRLESTKSKLQDEFAHTDDLEKRAKQVEELHRQEELRVKQIEKEVVDLKEEMFKQSQELFKMREEETNIIGEISGAQAQSKNLQATINKLDAESLKQKEHIYNAEFQIQQLERKVSRAQGVRSDEESKKLNARIKELTDELEQANVQHNMLTDQVKRLDDDIRTARRKVEDVTKARGGLENTISELTLENDTRQRNLKQAVREKEDTMVQHDVLKLEVKRLRDKLNNQSDEVFGLENRKTQLQMTMEERDKAIAIHLDSLRAQHKATEDERHKAAMELNDQLIKVDKLKKKYDSISVRNPEDGEEESQVYKVIRAAQEREELQRKGDKLDAEIRKAEKEILALERTLRSLVNMNQVYRESFIKSDLSSEDFGTKAELERQYQDAMRQVQTKKKQMEEIQEDLRRRESELYNTKEEQIALTKHMQSLENKRSQYSKDIEDQKAKLDRAHKQMTRLSKEHKRGRGLGEREESIEERDFRLKELKESNKDLLVQLFEFSKDHGEIQAVFFEALESSGIKLPKTTAMDDKRPGSAGSQRSSRSSGSVRSSVSSTRSSVSSKKSMSIITPTF